MSILKKTIEKGILKLRTFLKESQYLQWQIYNL